LVSRAPDKKDRLKIGLDDKEAKPVDQTTYPETVERVAELLVTLKHDKKIVMLPTTGKTCAEAASALGCDVAEIAKSIVFRRVADDKAVVVIASGADRVNEQAVADIVGPLAKADAKFVKAQTGYSIGGVSPIGLADSAIVLVDESLLAFQSLWAAAGHPHAVFNLTPSQLLHMTNASVHRLAE
jgi:prolyl-tRNA editing enzyme YbaK/EbsC (Cys-tRNA(Pro) deacylase)